MKHEIRIAEITEPPPENVHSYNRSTTIFEQTVDDLDIAAVVAVVNNLTKKRRRLRKTTSENRS